MTTRAQIDEFWSLKRLAIAGVSHNPQDFSRTVMSELQKRGYQVYPVNPNLKDVDGKPCYAQVQDIQPVVDGVIILTQPDATEQIVVDCAAAGVPRVWMHQGGGPGAISQNAIKYCQDHGVQVIAGYCPFMFLPGTPFFHRFHAWTLKLSGRYPN